MALLRPPLHSFLSSTHSPDPYSPGTTSAQPPRVSCLPFSSVGHFPFGSSSDNKSTRIAFSPLPLSSPSHPPPSCTTTYPSLCFTSPPFTLPLPTPRPTSPGNFNANSWMRPFARTGSSANGDQDSTNDIVCSSTTSTTNCGTKSKPRYLIQARNALFHSDNLLHPIGTLDARVEMRLRIALIHQRIWLVRQSHEFNCCAKVRRRARALIHPRSWRMMRELRSRLHPGPVSSMREEPGILNQRIQSLVNKMVYFDGTIDESEEEQQYEENDDAGLGVMSHWSHQGKPSRKRSSITPPIREEDLHAHDPTEVVVEIVEVPIEVLNADPVEVTQAVPVEVKQKVKQEVPTEVTNVVPTRVTKVVPTEVTKVVLTKVTKVVSTEVSQRVPVEVPGSSSAK